MRFVALALIIACFPICYGLLRQSPLWRPKALAALGFILFLGGNLRVSTYLYAWPLWAGTVRGIEISPLDMIGLALIFTRPRASGTLPFWGLLWAYFAVLLLTFALSAVPMASLFSCWQFARMLILFAAVAGEVSRPDLRRALLTGLSLGLLLQASYVIMQKLTGQIQAVGTIGHQNTLGMMVELAVLPLLAALLGGDRRKVAALGLLAAMAVIAGGGSRGTMGIAGGGMVVLVALSLGRHVTSHKLKIVGVGALALAVAVPLAITTLHSRFGNSSIITEESERAAFKRAAEAMTADHPLGVGPNMYVTTANTKGYAARAGVAWNLANRAAPVHDAYLLARAETGWLGEACLLLLLFVPLVRGLVFSFKDRMAPGAEAVLGSAVAIGANVVHNNYEFATLTDLVMSLLIVNIAIIAAELRAARAKSRRRMGSAGSEPRLQMA